MLNSPIFVDKALRRINAGLTRGPAQARIVDVWLVVGGVFATGVLDGGLIRRKEGLVELFAGLAELGS